MSNPPRNVSDVLSYAASFPVYMVGHLVGALAGGVRKGFYSLGYDAADRNNRHRNNLRSGRISPRSEDKLLGPQDRIMLRQHCLNLRRNDPIIAGVADRFSDNVVGSGIVPQAKTTDTLWNEEAEDHWRQWSKIAVVNGRINMRELQCLVVDQRLFAGDMAILLLDNGQIQPIEGERINTPRELEAKDERIVDGIKIDKKTGQMLGAYIFGRDKNGIVDIRSKGNWQYRRRENLIYITKYMRFDQVRGLPELTPVINTVRDLHELSGSVMTKAKLEAFNAYTVQKDSNAGPGNLGPRGSAVGSDIGATQLERLEEGMIHYLREGEKMEATNGSVPHTTYMDFTELILRTIGTGLGLPYEFILMDFSKGNFSASRAALLQTHRTFTGWQEWMTSQFLQRLWNWTTAKAIKSGKISPAPLDVNGISQWFQTDWSFPEFEWIDPNAEANAEQRQFAMGKRSMTDIVKKSGRDIEDVWREKSNDLDKAAMIAADLNDEYPDAGFTWQDIVTGSPAGAQQRKIEGSTASVDGGVKEN